MPYWLIIVFLAVLGACVGSFLNVVIYRLPRGESIVHPGSHCPRCNHAIRGYDNIPVLSWLLLGGKCRVCRNPISPRYALVELITAVLFVALCDAFYKAGMSPWFGDLPMDWPLFLAHLVLVAVLVACSAMDLEFYLIDVRITYVAVAAGLFGWMFLPELRVFANASLSALKIAFYAGIWGATVGLVIRQSLVRYSEGSPSEDTGGEEDAGEESEPSAAAGWPWIASLLIFIVGSVLLLVWSVRGGGGREDYTPRAFMYILWAFLAILAGAIPRRASDQEIVEIIEQEKSSARKVAGREFVSLLPVIGGFAAAFVLFRYVPALTEWGRSAYVLALGPFFPVMGLTMSLVGFLAAAAFGWLVRIGFTLVFGKEAMGVGDIYILAAIGAVAGPLVTIVGFFIGSVIGVFGIVILLLWKTSRALSYGPWIAIGTLTCLLFHEPIRNYLLPLAALVRNLAEGPR